LTILAIILGVVTMTFVTGYAAGMYDGVWYVDGELISLHENDDGQIVAIDLIPEDETYEIYWGELSGNYVRLYTIYGQDENITYDVTFTSESTAIITQVSCEPITPEGECDDPNGTTCEATKIW